MPIRFIETEIDFLLFVAKLTTINIVVYIIVLYKVSLNEV